MKYTKNLYLITLSLIFYALGAGAQTTAPAAQPYNFTLADCIKYAYEHQDSVKNAALDVKSADYKVKETIGIGLPQVSGAVSFQDYLKIPTIILNGSSFSIYQKYTNTFGANVSQILFDGSYLVGLQASKTYKELSQRSFTRSKIQTNVTVTKAYYQVLVSGEQIKLLDANIKQLKQQLDETTKENEQGFVEKIDVDRLTVSYNNLVTTRDNVARALVLNVQLLKFQMGMPIDAEFNLTDKLEDVKLDQGVAEVSVDTSFYKNRIEYNLLETSAKLNELQVKLKKVAFLPSLVATGNTSATLQNNNIGNLYDANYPSTFVGLTLSIPIFNGFQRHYQLKESQIALEKSRNDLYNLKNGLGLQASQARIVYANSIASLNNQKKNQALAEDVLRVTKIKYQQGVGSSIEVTQAQTEVETADNNYIQALYDALISKVNLDQAYGKIN